MASTRSLTCTVSVPCTSLKNEHIGWVAAGDSYARLWCFLGKVCQNLILFMLVSGRERCEWFVVETRGIVHALKPCPQKKWTLHYVTYNYWRLQRFRSIWSSHGDADDNQDNCDGWRVGSTSCNIDATSRERYNYVGASVATCSSGPACFHELRT